ncbi:uncharacterized protein C8A04DRAFT_29409 [Dichotomopilus funicola]|uniref:Uncharacterized protein n=1 Tax=Dichotomopilus funicola TaxID=1934379 RepID=A0AAN6V1A7_9PEZI|nr:hypothetical protein C8A04DRAFT_29409 [Dichotomopilus funicola]
MAYVDLSQRDINVLEKIKDPEFDPSLVAQVDPALPKDPHVSDPTKYQDVSQQERDIILTLQKAEMQNAKQQAGQKPGTSLVDEYHNSVSKLGQLIQDHPQYASARNNRVQALRRLYGDSLLISGAPRNPQALLQKIDDSERLKTGKIVLDDLDRAVSLLTPKIANTHFSPQAARTLSNAHTQRAAIYLMTSKLLDSGSASVDASRPESGWSKLDFEERASRDFAMGGRYGNEIAKGLAVSTNPTAKLCGQMVREAMKKEYGPGLV